MLRSWGGEAQRTSRQMIAGAEDGVRGMPVSVDDVQLIRWPIESARLDHYRRLGVPRLLVVEGQVEPPITTDLKEDWVRLPVSRVDLRTRVAILRARVNAQSAPEIDPGGTARYRSRSVTVSPIETALLSRLIDSFGQLVLREELQERLADGSGGKRNALDLHIMRLRRRIMPLGLMIRTAWGRGYVLENQPVADPAGVNELAEHSWSDADPAAQPRHGMPDRRGVAVVRRFVQPRV
jgi:two-component system, OmpR family, response regulator